MATDSAAIWSACDCVAKSGSSRLRCNGYDADAVPTGPHSLSTNVTRTLNVPKSTPATTAIVCSCGKRLPACAPDYTKRCRPAVLDPINPAVQTSEGCF